MPNIVPSMSQGCSMAMFAEDTYLECSIKSYIDTRNVCWLKRWQIVKTRVKLRLLVLLTQEGI